jgi:hypothetical protein
VKPALYIAYVSGATGSNVILLYVSDNMIAGVDAGTGKYVGKGERLPNGALRGTVLLTVPAGIPLITGMPALEKATDLPISFELPPGFDSGNLTVPITTPLGPINARFEKFVEVE